MKKVNKVIWTLELTEYMTKEIKETFDLEIEMLQGMVEKLPNGLTRYIIEVKSEYKIRMIKDFMQMAMFGHLKTSNN